MILEYININGIDLDVYYNCQKCRDAYGTGDSPTLYDIDITSINLGGDPTNISSILSDSVLNDIEQQIIDIESN